MQRVNNLNQFKAFLKPDNALLTMVLLTTPSITAPRAQPLHQHEG